LKEEEEKFRMRLAEKVQIEEKRFRQWEQRVYPSSIILYP